MEILYHFSLDSTGEMLTLKTLLKDKKDPHIESLANMIKGAEWIEREMWEMLGINFIGHPNLKRLLLDEELPEDFHPLRKEKK
ncbi:MAG: NADH-quinone oxidoreductase subunit C [Candidatus Omnitrophica bacterium]|nr:NADH-quinone oxidoreductase subunit C [Candidatus Omnitrophota bacterium]